MDTVLFYSNRIYHLLSHWAYGHKNSIVIRVHFRSDNKPLGLAELMQVQDQWGNLHTYDEKKELNAEERDMESGKK